jgi:transposase
VPSLTKKIISGKPYYYLRQCERVNGRPKIVWTHYLGTPQRLVERLSSPAPLQVIVAEFGASAAVFDVATALDVAATVDRHVPKRGTAGPSVGQYLLLAALNRCLAPRSKARLYDWYRRTALRRLLPLTASQVTSQRFWDNMDRVGPEQIAAIEAEIAARAVSHFGLDLRCLLFDATNFFTFVDSFNDGPDLLQRGHSKEGRDNLRLLGLALLVTADGDIPLFHHTYAGNQHDSVTFGEVTESLTTRLKALAQGAVDVTLVFDKGNNSEDNLAAMADAKVHFVGSLVPTHHRDLLAVPRKAMRRLDTAQLPAVWAHRTKKVVFGVARTVLCTFNQPLYDAQVKTLRREISKRQRRLSALKAALLRPTSRGKQPTVAGVQKKVTAILRGRHMKDLFSADVRAAKNGRPTLTFQFLKEAWRNLDRTLLGKTILFTDRAEWTDEQIVLGYRAQHHVEASFRRMKDPHYLTFRPMFHWTDQKLRVHAFCCVLALMIASLLRRRLAKAGVEVSVAKVFERLSAIEEVTMLYPAPPGKDDPVVRTMLSTQEPDQRAMVEALGLERYAAQ